MSPVIPHFANESLEKIGIKKDIVWPKINENLLIEKTVNIVIQINGKTREVSNVERDLNEETLFETIKESNKLKKYFVGKTIKKKIFIQNKLINLIVN